MKRPRQHLIDAAGKRQLRSIFEPLGWTVNEVENDYGVDFDVEVFHEGRTTGATFKVQLKSSGATEYSSERDFISQTIGSDAATYLCQEMRSPVVLIHADVEQKRTFWLAPQLDTNALRKLVGKAQSRTIRLRIPISNELPKSVGPLLAAIGRVETLLASRVVATVRVRDFVASTRNLIDGDELIREFKAKADALKISKVQELLAGGAISEARERIERLIADGESSVEMKFTAVLVLEGIEARSLREGNSPVRSLLDVQSLTVDRLCPLAHRGPAPLKFFVLIAKKSHQLSTVAQEDYSLYINWTVNQENGHPLWKLQLVFERARVARKVVRAYEQCLRLAGYASGYKHRWALPRSLLRIVGAVSVFILRLREEGLAQGLSAYAATALQVCRLAASISLECQDEEGVSEAILAAPMIDPTEESSALAWANEALTLIMDSRLRKETEARLVSIVNELRKRAGNSVPPFEGLRRMFEEMAGAVGIDLADPDDPAAELVRVGIADMDPSRVLANCEHIFLSFGESNQVAEFLKLPTARRKIVHCDLHRKAVEGPDLDGTYAYFKQTYCEKCLDCSPRGAMWEYSEEWQQEENRKHVEFLAEFDRGRRTQGQ